MNDLQFLTVFREWLYREAGGLAKNLLAALLIFFVGNAIVRKALAFFTRHLRKREVDETAIGFLHSLLSVLLRIFVIIMALATLQVPMASLTAVIAAASLSVGLALQGSLANLAGGILLVLFRPFRVGDYLITQEAEGKVREVGLLTTSLVTYDNRLIFVPNAQISSQTLTNVSAFKQRRVDVKVHLHRDADPKEVRAMLIGVAKSLSWTLPERPVDVVMNSSEDASLRMTLRFWVATQDYWRAYAEGMEQVRETLRIHGVEYYVPSMRLEREERENA